MNTHLQHLWDNVDKILLVTLLIVTIIIHVHVEHELGGAPDPTLVNEQNWLENIIGQILAALLTLMVTQRAKGPTSQAQLQTQDETITVKQGG